MRAYVAIILLLTAVLAALLWRSKVEPPPSPPRPAVVSAQPAYDWAIDPQQAGPNLPAVGRSLFDFVFANRHAGQSAYDIAYPFERLVENLRQRLGGDAQLSILMIPMGRSLQRSSAAPSFFKYPRVVLAVTGGTTAHRDRLYLGYQEKMNLIEVISYNEAAGRFEFQLVKDYAAGMQPRVFYANRNVCITCHQNHAPIFSRGLWEETNANLRVAALLGDARQDFYALPLRVGEDVANAIDEATDRANLLAASHTLWREGCGGDDAHGHGCRAGLLRAILQYGLSGGRDFDAAAPGFQADYVRQQTLVWQQRWPRGLAIGDADIPNRNPFPGGDPELIPAQLKGYGARELALAAHVPEQFDPLQRRAPREVLRFAGAADHKRAVYALAEHFSAADWRELDQALRALPAQPKLLQAKCKLERVTNSNLQLRCGEAGAPWSLAANLSSQDAAQVRVDRLMVGAWEVATSDVQFETIGTRTARRQRLVELRPHRGALSVRLVDGTRLGRLSLSWPVATKGAVGEARLEVLDDFAQLDAVLRGLAQTSSAALAGQAFRPSLLLPALLQQLNYTPRARCCFDTAGMPPAQLDSAADSDVAGGARGLEPFVRYCAKCHLSREQVPPNFLYGDAQRVAQALKRCAPRMLVRLAMWDSASARSKSPMPPVTALHGLGVDQARWAASAELRSMRRYVEGLLAEHGVDGGLPALLRQNYELLPNCISTE